MKSHVLREQTSHHLGRSKGKLKKTALKQRLVKTSPQTGSCACVAVSFGGFLGGLLLAQPPSVLFVCECVSLASWFLKSNNTCTTSNQENRHARNHVEHPKKKHISHDLLCLCTFRWRPQLRIAAPFHRGHRSSGSGTNRRAAVSESILHSTLKRTSVPLGGESNPFTESMAIYGVPRP